MNLLIAFAIGLLTGSFLTIFVVAATTANHFDEREGHADDNRML